ncbi:type II secretion system protein J [Patescibacteria group bacterium]
MIGSIKKWASRILHGRNTEPGGFTLVEVLIAMGVVSITAVISVQLLLIFFQSQAVTRDVLYLEGNARNIVATVNERTRQGFVDFNFYAAEPKYEPEYLAIRSETGIQTVFWLDDSSGEMNIYLCDEKGLDESCSKGVDPELDPDWSQMNPEDLDFSTAKFSITPDVPPFFEEGVLEPSTDNAPLVRVNLQLEMDDTLTRTPLIQTAVTPRFYGR